MCDLKKMKDRLEELLMTIAYKEGKIVLASGKTSNFYIDCKQVSLHPEGIDLLGALFFSMLEGYDIAAVAGVTMGGDPLVTSTSLFARGAGQFLPALIIRKSAKGHGTGRFVEGMKNVEKGSSIVLLEDVVTSGGSSITACEKAEADGFKVAAIFCIVDRQEGGRQNLTDLGYTLKSIFTREELLGNRQSKTA